jgi:hypothetical protein
MLLPAGHTGLPPAGAAVSMENENVSNLQASKHIYKNCAYYYSHMF